MILILFLKVFVVDKSGKLNYMWQSKRHGKWNAWKIVTDMQSDALANLPTVLDDRTGWWIAYGVCQKLIFDKVVGNMNSLVYFCPLAQ